MFGLASDEWEANGIWVNFEYQRKGIGKNLLQLFRNQFPEDRKMGQMTTAGKNLVCSYTNCKN